MKNLKLKLETGSITGGVYVLIPAKPDGRQVVGLVLEKVSTLRLAGDAAKEDQSLD